MSFRRKEDFEYHISYDPTNEVLNGGANYNGLDYTDKTQVELHTLFDDALKTRMHGLCFSLYEDGQNPGDIITE